MTYGLRVMRFVTPLVGMVMFSTPVPAAQPGRDCPNLPEDFVYLTNVDDTIIQEIYYATERNFVGAVVDGYEAPQCVLRLEAAHALSRVQRDLLNRGYSLKVFDCYRPERAVENFVRWSQSDDDSTKTDYYPSLRKKDLMDRGYIARQSMHSLGISVDLTVVELRPKAAAVLSEDDWIGQPRAAMDSPPDEGSGKKAEDGASLAEGRICQAPAADSQYAELDMGTSFDCFDERSNTLSRNVPDGVLQNRLILKKAMEKHGFENYRKEWWHFNFSRLKPGISRQNFPIRSPDVLCHGPD